MTRAVFRPVAPLQPRAAWRGVRSAYSALAGAVLLSCLAASGASAQMRAPTSDMEASTVRIFSALLSSSDEPRTASSGSGFVLENAHVVTNAHVLLSPEGIRFRLGRLDKQLSETTDAQRRAQLTNDRRELSQTLRALETGALQTTTIVLLDASTQVHARVVWSSDKDLAILKLDRPTDRLPVSFAPSRFVRGGDAVWAVGFPGAADALGGEQDVANPTITNGIVGRSTDNNGRRVLQHDARIHFGSSGGPLFNACGQVVGVNDGGVDAGFYSAIQADELLAALPGLNIPYRAVDRACDTPPSGAETVTRAAIALSLLLGGAAVWLAATSRGRTAVAQQVRQTRHSISEMSRHYGLRKAPSIPAPVMRPVLLALEGPYRGSTLELGDDLLTIGRDPRVSQLVFPSDAAVVSKRHCSLRFHRVQQVFSLEDCWSANGTYLESGEQLTPDVPRPLRSGDRFYVGDPQYAFEVRLDT